MTAARLVPSARSVRLLSAVAGALLGGVLLTAQTLDTGATLWRFGSLILIFMTGWALWAALNA